LDLLNINLIFIFAIMELNPKDILDDVIAALRLMSEYSSKPNHVGEYSNQYHDNDWTEKHPSALVEITGVFPSSRDATGRLSKQRGEFTIYVAQKLNEPKHPLEYAGAIIDALEGQEFSYDSGLFYSKLLSMNLFASRKDLKVYTLRYGISA
jgi:hypothetical protein